MIRVELGKNAVSLNEISINHWNLLNPLREDTKEYNVVGSLIGRINSAYLRHLRNQEWGKVAFYRLLRKNGYSLLRELITCPSENLKNLIDYATTVLGNLGLYTDGRIDENFKTELLDDIFQYDNWRSNGKGQVIFELLNLSVCPYCNLDLIFVDYDRDIVVATFDHYYDKAIYPYLALSFFNLIPCCKNCNEVFKKSKTFCIDTHLHPYLDDYNTLCQFECSYVDPDVEFEVNWKVLSEPKERGHVYSSDLSFTARYNERNVKDFAGFIVNLAQEYSYESRLDYSTSFEIPLSVYERKICKTNMIPYMPSEVLNRQYGKLKRDIALQTFLISSNEL